MQAAEKLAQVTAVLSPEQLAEAQRQLAAWQPGHCLQRLFRIIEPMKTTFSAGHRGFKQTGDLRPRSHETVR